MSHRETLPPIARSFHEGLSLTPAFPRWHQPPSRSHVAPASHVPRVLCGVCRTPGPLVPSPLEDAEAVTPGGLVAGEPWLRTQPFFPHCAHSETPGLQGGK